MIAVAASSLPSLLTSPSHTPPMIPPSIPTTCHPIQTHKCVNKETWKMMMEENTVTSSSWREVLPAFADTAVLRDNAICSCQPASSGCLSLQLANNIWLDNCLVNNSPCILPTVQFCMSIPSTCCNPCWFTLEFGMTCQMCVLQQYQTFTFQSICSAKTWFTRGDGREEVEGGTREK